MQPRILIRKTGQVFPLRDGITMIGRDESADIVIPDLLLSRKHCFIHNLELHECGSLNGTRLNGSTVTSPRPLMHGDRIDVGEAELTVLIEEDEPVRSAETPARVPKATVLANTNILLAQLIGGAGALCGLRDTASIQTRLFSIIFSNTPADRAALSIGGALTFRERDGSVKSFPLDRDEPHFTLCLPMETLGARDFIYAEICEADSTFNTGHAELLKGMAAVAGLAFEHASTIEQLQAQNSRLRQDLDLRNEMIGGGPAMSALETLVNKAAPADTRVLIQGESGTGKELVARAVHRQSRRAGKPFVALNCAALTPTLIETELFGYEKAAFTGATAMKTGLIEEASGGTLFLDEIGEMPLELQPKLLRALQEGEIRRVGGTKPIPIDVRVIAATNRDLAKEVAEKRFRQDLFYRLSVVTIKTPALRERREDIPAITGYLIRKMAKKLGRVMAGISKEAEALLVQYAWPGNVRELENAIERAILLGSGTIIMPEDLPADMLEGLPPDLPSMRYVDEVNACRRKIIERAMRETGDDAQAAAKRLGIGIATVYRFSPKT